MSAFPKRSQRCRPLETREWLDALEAVIEAEGPERAHFLLEALIDEARQIGIDMPFSANTAYVNTIPPDQEERSPGNSRSRSACAPTCAGTRWRWWSRPTADRRWGDLGGHIAVRIAHTCSAPVSTTSGTPRAKATAATALHPGPQVARHLRPRLSWKAASDRRAAAQLPPGGRRQGLSSTRTPS